MFDILFWSEYAKHYFKYAQFENLRMDRLNESILWSACDADALKPVLPVLEFPTKIPENTVLYWNGAMVLIITVKSEKKITPPSLNVSL